MIGRLSAAWRALRNPPQRRLITRVSIDVKSYAPDSPEEPDWFTVVSMPVALDVLETFDVLTTGIQLAPDDASWGILWLDKGAWNVRVRLELCRTDEMVLAL